MTTITVSVFSPNARTLLCKRYVCKGEGHEQCPSCLLNHETEDEMFRRWSLGNQQYEYELLRPLKMLPNSPTLFNAPCPMHPQEVRGTLSACFKFDVQDTMVSIMDVATLAAMVLKHGGGVGYVFSELRPKGSPIKTTHGQACGPVAVIRFYNELAKLITQSGKRQAAQMAILHCDHADLAEFIHAKDVDPQALSTFNISVACTEAFMRRANGGNEPLFEEMVQSAWLTGDPGCYFIDTAERTNPTPWLGQLTGTNPCGEVCLLENEPCNLGSINLKRVAEHELEAVTRLAVRYLDDILDANHFPDPRITAAALATRKLGLGVMGWADMLASMGLHYDSSDAIDYGTATMNRIQNVAHDESQRLGAERGCIEGLDRRNATLTCIAPTGSIAILADCYSGIEPYFGHDVMRTMGDGTQLPEVREQGDSDHVPHIASEIDWRWHIDHQAAFQQYTDLAVSKTINLPNSATPDDVRGAYLRAWETGCKGTTIYRDGCVEGREQVLKHASTPDVPVAYGTLFERHAHQQSGDRIPAKDVPKYISMIDGMDGPDLGPPAHQHHRKRMPALREALIQKFQVGDLEGYAIAGKQPDGTPGELFIEAAKEGSTVSGLLDVVGILTSLALQYGVPLETLVSKFKGISFEPSGFTDHPTIKQSTSVIDFVFRWMGEQFLTAPHTASNGHSNGNMCPQCHAPVVYAEGCQQCSKACGWTRC